MIWAFNFHLKEFIETSPFIEFGIDSQQSLAWWFIFLNPYVVVSILPA